MVRRKDEETNPAKCGTRVTSQSVKIPGCNTNYLCRTSPIKVHQGIRSGFVYINGREYAKVAPTDKDIGPCEEGSICVQYSDDGQTASIWVHPSKITDEFINALKIENWKDSLHQ